MRVQVQHSYCYAIYYESNGRRRIGGSSNSPEQAKAVQKAIWAAKRAGFTHYRLEGTDEVCALASE